VKAQFSKHIILVYYLTVTFIVWLLPRLAAIRREDYRDGPFLISV